MAENASDNPWVRATQAMIAESFDNWRRLTPFAHAGLEGPTGTKGATPAEVVYEEDRLQLLHYHSDAPPRYRTPLVVVFALVNRPYILDILPDKSVVSHFVRAASTRTSSTGARPPMPIAT